MEVVNTTRHEVEYRLKEAPIARPSGQGGLVPGKKALSAGDRDSPRVNWIIEFFQGGKVIAREKVRDSSALVTLVEEKGQYEVRIVRKPESRQAAREPKTPDLVEAMLPPLPDVLPSRVAVLQARRNAEARASLLREFGALRSLEVAELAGSRAANRAALANRWRQEGRIFSVSYQGTTLYPAFQFDAEGRPRPVVAEVIRTLGSKSADWELALWFTANIGWLDGQRPVDLLESDPAAVAEAAESEAAELVF